jgi:hypothetical protein
LDKHAPGKPYSIYLKRWWTDDIKQERRRFGRARREFKDNRTSIDDHRRVTNDYYRFIRRAKRLAWERFLEGSFPPINSHNSHPTLTDVGRRSDTQKFRHRHILRPLR